MYKGLLSNEGLGSEPNGVSPQVNGYYIVSDVISWRHIRIV